MQMKRLLVFVLTCILSGFMSIACQREQTVEASREPGSPDTYQPRPAPKKKVEPQDNTWNQAMSGELLRVNIGKKTFSIRAENGMEQTFKFSDQTSIEGIGSQRSQLRDLLGKEGSQTTVQWKDEERGKTALNVNVTDLAVKKTSKRNKARKGY
jgi:hypothetical protein